MDTFSLCPSPASAQDALRGSTLSRLNDDIPVVRVPMPLSPGVQRGIPPRRPKPIEDFPQGMALDKVRWRSFEREKQGKYILDAGSGSETGNEIFEPANGHTTGT